SLDGVAEVATVGGMVKEYQVLLDPDRLRVYGISLDAVRSAIEASSRDASGSVVELAEAEYMVRARGYVTSLDDLRRTPLKVTPGGPGALAGSVVTLGDGAEVRLGPETRRGIADLDGEGEVAGGVVILRNGANAQRTITAVKQRLAELRSSLPA